MSRATRNSISTATPTRAAICAGLLQFIAQMRLKLIVRPGPLIGDQWRNGGYPPWLLAYSNYKMSASDIQKGMAPPDAELAAA